MKLGEALVKKGLLTKAQLDLALKSQLIFGGHLGTSLIETGLLDEDTLGEVLASSAGVPHAGRQILANIRPATIKAVPKRIAAEYQAIPFKIEGNSLHVAFVNPRDLRSLDALKFTTGRKIVPWIAPEVRVLQALERYYDVERRARYIRLDHKLAAPQRVTSARAKPARVPPKDDIDYLSAFEPEPGCAYGRPWQEVAAEMFGRDFAEIEPRKSSMSLSNLAERYGRAESRDDLARTALDFVAGRSHRTLLMFVRGNWASVWMERGFSLADQVRSGAQFDVTSEALFHLLMGNDHYHGALPANVEVRSFYDRLGAAAPSELLLIPIHVNDRLIAAALADGGPTGRIEGEVDELVKAFRLFSTAVMMVALKKNLRDVARPLAYAEKC
jgi:hypothetical protein